LETPPGNNNLETSNKAFFTSNILQMNTIGKIAIAAAAGVVAGGVLGLLFAPDKGVNTRKKITDSGKKLTDTVKEKMNGLKVNIRNKADAVREEMEEMA
jgi:gas vesicle protein